MATWTELTVFQSYEDRRVVSRAGEVASLLFIPKQSVLLFLKDLSPLQPRRIKAGLVQVQKGSDQEGVVLQKPRNWSRAGGKSFLGFRLYRKAAIPATGHGGL
jgi:hypothetical protein